jgi:hypothetical protein
MQKTGVSYLTSYHAPLIGVFTPGPILGMRKMTQHYFAARDLLRQLPSAGSIAFQDGDGDVVFV